MAIIVKQSNGKGRGVFASVEWTFIPKGMVIHTSPVIVIPVHFCTQPKEVGEILDRYVYVWGEETAIALGVGSLFNHSRHPNVHFLQRIDSLEIEYTALRNIADGEELTIDYGYDPLGYVED